jgi:uncharacterized repeat protein (TIGR04076 family)
MTRDDASKKERRWKNFQEHLGFTGEELEIFRSNPNHVKAMEEAPAFATHNIIIDILESHNCTAGYRAGDRFVVDGLGFLINEKSPQRLCIGAISSFKTLIDRMWQAFFDGKTEVLHDTIRCPDVGVHRGGWGEITMRVRAVPKKREGKGD